MADDASASSDTGVRWTCEACGCHTNTESNDPNSCGVCGTRRVSSLLLRRGILRSSSGFGNHQDDDEDDHEEEDDEDDNSDDNSDDDDEGVEENNAEENEIHPHHSSQALTALTSRRRRNAARSGASGMSISNMNVPRRNLVQNNNPLHSSGLSAPPIMLHQNPHASTRSTQGPGQRATHPNPDELLAAATENAGLWEPKWSSTHCGNSIQIIEKNHQVASLTEGGKEGRCVRALTGFPSFTDDDVEQSSEQRRSIFGWRIAFEHSTRDRGKSMGGCYLVGVTTDAFAAYSERSGLQQSRLFWGVEDGGRRYEGGTTTGRRQLSSQQGQSGNGPGGPGMMQLSRTDAPRNSENLLFGSKEVLTIVADLGEDSRTLYYWRDGRFLGGLVSGLPSGGDLFPVAVPFNAGVCVAISGMKSEPLSILSEHHLAQKVIRDEKNDLLRQALLDREALLLQNKNISPNLILVLRNIWSWYLGADLPIFKNTNALVPPRLGALAAARLWYRSGLKLSQLKLFLQASSNSQEKKKCWCITDGKKESRCHTSRMWFCYI